MSGDHNMHCSANQPDNCVHLWRYIGNKRQAAWVCAYCQALRTSEPPAVDSLSVVNEIVEMLEAMHEHDKDRHNYYLIAANVVRNNFGEHNDEQ